MKCHACRQDNADSALFCSACRRPLVAPTALPRRLEPLTASAAPAMAIPRAAAEPGFARDRFAPPNSSAAGRMGDDSDVLTEQEAWGAVIGDSNTDYYLTRFERLARGEGARWHWPALLVTWYWMLYRKMWVPALIYFFVPGIVVSVLSALMPSAAGPLLLAWWLTLFIAPAMMANGWYFGHCKAKIRDVRARGGSKEQMLARLEAAGGTSNIIVIIVAIFALIAGIGILAAVALPAYQTYTVKAKVSDAALVGDEMAATVGKQYEQTGVLPSNSDVERMLSGASHQSKFVRGIEIDGTTGALTVRVNAGARIDGAIVMVPSADTSGNHHLTWTCMNDGLQRYAPARCRIQAPASR